MRELILGKFVPPLFQRANLDLKEFDAGWGKQLHYASNGRSAIYQILLNDNIRTTKILLPAYLCSSVLIPLRKANIEAIFYDINPDDLNGDIESLEHLAAKHSVQVALLPSMYGNPADLLKAEELCRRKGIYLIDDAAQSFGALLADRPVGTFGDAGFFSVSPGKPLAGHMGAFYWSDKTESPRRTRHDLIHYLKWLDFRIRRQGAYTSSKYLVLNPLLEYGMVALTKLVDLTYDDMAPFEAHILGGLLQDSLAGCFGFRQKYFDEFYQAFSQNRHFSVVRSLRGAPHNHKIVLRCMSRESSAKLKRFLGRRYIYSNGGYPMLSPSSVQLKNAARIDGCIVELPIENDEAKMKYLFDVVQEFIDGKNTRDR